MMFRKLLYVGLTGVALVAAFLALRNLGARGSPAAPGPAAKGPPVPGAPLPVYTHEVRPRLLQETITATGTLLADEAVDLVSELAGKVVQIAFEEDSRVRRGDVLVRIDDTELRAQLARAESRVELARLQERRQRQLGIGLGTTQDALDAAVHEARALGAEVALVQAQLAKTEIRAPFDGLIGLRHVSEGAYVTPNTRITSLQRIDPIKIEFSVAERHLERLRRDAIIGVGVAGFERPIEGTIYAFEPRIDVSTRMLRVRARAPNPEGRALPGGFATVAVPLREIPGALMVPADALVPGFNAQQLYVLENGRAAIRQVEVGVRLPREVHIVSGLQAGDVVITSGQLQLRPGVAVESLGDKAAAVRENPQS